MATTTATKRLTEIQGQVIDLADKVQEPVIDGIRRVVDAVEGRIPQVKVPYKANLPTIEELVDNQYKFAQSVVGKNKAFADGVLDATAPVRKKFVDADLKVNGDVKVTKSNARTKKAA